jgi:hypothetical protein
MDDERAQLKALERGDRAKKFLESEEWVEAWDTYRTRIIEQIDKAASDDAATVMHLKRLLAAARAAQGHLETLMVNGRIAVKNLELIEKQKRGFFRRVA